MTGNADDGFQSGLSPEDERLTDRLRDLLRTVDDVPEAVRTAARSVFAGPLSDHEGGREERKT